MCALLKLRYCSGKRMQLRTRDTVTAALSIAVNVHLCVMIDNSNAKVIL
jgi:hypothetical protein